MRRLLLAAAAIGALAIATAMAQNTSPNDPNGTAGVNDKMNSSSTQGGAMGRIRPQGPRRTPHP
jgi:hypothetical protein